MTRFVAYQSMAFIGSPLDSYFEIETVILNTEHQPMKYHWVKRIDPIQCKKEFW